ncbi:MAG: OsmC family peroxiredoxin [Chloroflexi bacterium]|nr:OsmC family peroxiredoxin [Chloroflexota bacterium]
MTEFLRSASVVWNGDSRRGSGTVSTGSGALTDVPYTYLTRFGENPGTNPEELLAAAHAACFSMALASTLRRAGHAPERIETRAVCVMERDETTGVAITTMRLRTRALVPGLDAAEFARLADDAKVNCPVSQVLAPGLAIELDAALL